MRERYELRELWPVRGKREVVIVISLLRSLRKLKKRKSFLIIEWFRTSEQASERKFTTFTMFTGAAANWTGLPACCPAKAGGLHHVNR